MVSNETRFCSVHGYMDMAFDAHVIIDYSTNESHRE
jgi:hypothetical protein